MKRTNTTPLFFVLGTVLLAGVAACVFVYNCFENRAYDIDTHDEDYEDYL
jgi:hypothetical protein